MATIDLMVEGLIELSIVCFADECAMDNSGDKAAIQVSLYNSCFDPFETIAS